MLPEHIPDPSLDSEHVEIDMLAETTGGVLLGGDDDPLGDLDPLDGLADDADLSEIS